MALFGRLYRIGELPEVNDPQPVRSAVALRTIAEKYRLPVLHRVDSDTGQHEFPLITVQRGAFFWSPSLTCPGLGQSVRHTECHW
ncbi:MAG TPA: hypothetical protein DEH05_16150 [Propionibacteriaceae bacterium]|nr:hypothetical protein [Propionibacteriaceae bacterium]